MAHPELDLSDLTAQAVDNLVTQFSSSLDFYRELIQNSIDAGSSTVDVWLEYIPGDADAGTIAIHVDDAGEGMSEEIIDTQLTRGRRLDGLRIVVDCANGAAYRTAPDVLWELGAEVVRIAVAPNGFNINKDCGSTHTAAAVEAVKLHRADLGISLDGDADRVMIIDETGEIADGDQFMALIADRWAAEGRLAQGTLVATVMSNLGLERHLESQGLRLLRTAVGDRYVVEAMRAGGYNLGGEQSGHIVMTDHVTTGDGLIAALQFLSAMVETGRKASELSRVFQAYPQLLTNVRFRKGAEPLSEASVQSAISDGEARLDGRGRLVIRKSGTEPLVRIMGECDDPELLRVVLGNIEAEVARFA